MISKWNGKLYIIYLPLFNYSTGNDSSPMFNLDYEYRKFVLSIANELDLPIIDIFSEVFDSHSDPSSLFPYRMEGHYNALGYRLVANAINQRLQADGIFPSNLNY
jgi:lysophospholipase L1-like esterase